MTHHVDVAEHVELWRYPSVYAEEAVVEDGGEREGLEGGDACFVDFFGVFPDGWSKKTVIKVVQKR